MRLLVPAPILSRRAALQGLSVSFAAAYAPKALSAAGARDPRVVVIILRGALDGLTAVAPIGDPDYALLHGALALAGGWRPRRSSARRLFRAQSGDAGFRPPL